MHKSAEGWNEGRCDRSRRHRGNSRRLAETHL